MKAFDVLLWIILGLLLFVGLPAAMYKGGVEDGIKRGRAQELCKPSSYDHWIDDHNLICKKADGTLELQHQ